MLDLHSTSAAIAAAQPRMAVWGIGAIEQHGQHLPIGTDWIAASQIAARVAAELDALLLPAIPFSMSECHGSMVGTVWLKPATLAAVVRDVVRSLRAQGIRRLLIINGHGGNFVLEPVIQALNYEFPDIRVAMPPEAAGAGGAEGEALFEVGWGEVHAGEVETSTQLYFNPELVKPLPTDYVPPVGREFFDYLPMPQLNPQGVWGSPSFGNAEKGRRAIEADVQALVAFARQVLGG
jgi:creatinine amidohydrolase